MVDEDLRELERTARTGSSADRERFLQALLRSGKGSETLAALVEEWRATRSPAIANAVERLSARLEHEWPHAPSREALHALWLEKAAQPVDVGALLPLLPVGELEDEVVERLEAIEKWPLDPRTTSALVKIVAAAARRTRVFRELWSLVLEALVALDDTRALPALEAVPGAFPFAEFEDDERWLVEKAKKLVELLRARPPREPRQELREVAEALVDVAPVLSDTATRARAAVLDDPQNLEKRLAFGRSLPEGDLRRVLVELQERARANKLDLAGKKWVRSLVSLYGQEWAGDLAAFLERDALDFALGFVSTAKLRSDLPREALHDLAANPACATIETLWVPRAEADALTALLGSPFLKSLKTLIARERATVLAVAASSPLEAVEFTGAIGTFHEARYDEGWNAPTDDVDKLTVDAELIRSFGLFPKARRLALPGQYEWGRRVLPDDEGFRELLAGPLFQRLEHFELSRLNSGIEAWLSALERLSPRTFATTFDDDRMPNGGAWIDITGWTLTFSRREDGRFAHLLAEYRTKDDRPRILRTNHLDEWIGSVANDRLDSVVVRHPPSWEPDNYVKKSIKAVAKRARISVVRAGTGPPPSQ